MNFGASASLSAPANPASPLGLDASDRNFLSAQTYRNGGVTVCSFKPFERISMINQASPQSFENRGTGLFAGRGIFPFTDPFRFVAAAQEYLNPSAVSFFIVANSRLSHQLLGTLASAKGVLLQGEARSLKEAADKIGEHPPEVMFLEWDPDGSTREDLENSLKSWNEPGVVLIVHSPSDALHAYQVHALDCLVMPIDREGVVRSVGDVLERVRLRRASKLGREFLGVLRSAPTFLRGVKRIPVRSNGRISFLRTDDVEWIEAQGDYVCLHVGSSKHLVRSKISAMEQQLGSPAFVRIHRSTIVNVERIRELQPLAYGDYAVVLVDGTRLTLSRSYRQRALLRLMQARSA
jgi:two-component system LytT family response regulator